jgi:hypothetical protein
VRIFDKFLSRYALSGCCGSSWGSWWASVLLRPCARAQAALQSSGWMKTAPNSLRDQAGSSGKGDGAMISSRMRLAMECQLCRTVHTHWHPPGPPGSPKPGSKRKPALRNQALSADELRTTQEQKRTRGAGWCSHSKVLPAQRQIPTTAVMLEHRSIPHSAGARPWQSQRCSGAVHSLDGAARAATGVHGRNSQRAAPQYHSKRRRRRCRRSAAAGSRSKAQSSRRMQRRMGRSCWRGCKQQRRYILRLQRPQRAAANARGPRMR